MDFLTFCRTGRRSLAAIFRSWARLGLITAPVGIFRVNHQIYLVAGIIGALGVGLAVYCLIACYLSARTNEPAETVAVGLTIFILGSMVLNCDRALWPDGNQPAHGRSRLVIAFGALSCGRRLPVLSLYCWPRLTGYSTPLSLFALALAAGTIPSQLRAGAEYATWRKTTEDAALQPGLRREGGTKFTATFPHL